VVGRESEGLAERRRGVRRRVARSLREEDMVGILAVVQELVGNGRKWKE
jgi:hypothetical protein